MTKQQIIAEQLSLFNNRSFTKKQWEVILQGCGCPKSAHFWAALKNHNFEYYKKANIHVFTMVDMTIETFEIVWQEYCIVNRTSVKKAYSKAKAIKNAEERRKNFKGVTLYMVNGVLTSELPRRDD